MPWAERTPMRCDDVKELMSARLDGPLTPEEDSRLAEHLKDCGECRREAEKLEETVGWLRSLEPVPPPPGLAATLRQRLDLEPVRPVGWGWLNLPSVRLALAASLMIALTMGGLRILHPVHQGVVRVGDGAASPPSVTLSQDSFHTPELSDADTSALAPAPAAAPVAARAAASTPPREVRIRVGDPDEAVRLIEAVAAWSRREVPVTRGLSKAGAAGAAVDRKARLTPPATVVVLAAVPAARYADLLAQLEAPAANAKMKASRGDRLEEAPGEASAADETPVTVRFILEYRP